MEAADAACGVSVANSAKKGERCWAGLSRRSHTNGLIILTASACLSAKTAPAVHGIMLKIRQYLLAKKLRYTFLQQPKLVSMNTNNLTSQWPLLMI